MGIGQFFKNIFAGDDDDPKGLYRSIVDQAWSHLIGKKDFWNTKIADIAVFETRVLPLTNKEKAGFVIHLVKNIQHYYNSNSSLYTANQGYQKIQIKQVLLGQLSKMRIDLDEEDIGIAIKTAIQCNKRAGHFSRIPLKGILNQVQKKFPNGVLPPGITKVLVALEDKLKTDKDFCTEIEAVKLGDQIREIMQPAAVKPERAVLFPGDTEFSSLINSDIAAMAPGSRIYWYRLIALSKKASGSKPSKKYLDECHELIKQAGINQFVRVMANWLDFLSNLKEREVRGAMTFGDTTYQGASYEFLPPALTENTKGLVWMCATLKDAELLQRVGRLAERAFRKIPGQGQSSTAIGNACLYTLYKTEGLEGIGHLSRLKTRIKLNSTQQLIEKYIRQAAEDRELPVTAIEDMSVDELGVHDEKCSFELEGYRALLKIEKVGKVNLSWAKADGSIQKAEPASLKEKYPDQLKKTKMTAKQIELSLSAQRDRLDSSFKAEIKYSWAHFKTYYVNHGLLSYFCRRMIWNFEMKGKTSTAYWLNDNWVDLYEQVLEIRDVEAVSLWHPALATVEEVQAWRSFLIDREIQQPLKQAFREIYLLTDAELNTRTYSNRMASHLLKQHQFNSLTKARNWKYTLQGAFDNGASGIAYMDLPHCGLTAEYWTDGIGADDSLSPAGIFNYVATDQVRFSDMVTKEAVPLIDVPAQVFSEVMRDVDLFVGVTSVGNDPAWRDNGGLPAYRDYWQAYSFGDLGEAGKGRKEILARLLPRLKIAKVAQLKDKFLVVKGKKRTYKIHLGSTNILMEPNDQYLCIVPDRSQKNMTDSVFLPFEGDAGLSVIISKAFLLADDDKITDSTILTQIDR